MFAIFPLLLAMAATPPPPSAVLESPTRHIRTTNAYVSSLLKDGFYRSPTFARLVTRLERSDLIVYIELLERMPSGIEGRMMMMPRTHDHRYVRIQIEMQGSNADGVALLGHELQHARELADAPSVTDMAGFVALFERIGKKSGAREYETVAATETALQVRHELLM